MFLRGSVYLNNYGYRKHFAMRKKICYLSYLIIIFSKTKDLMEVKILIKRKHQQAVARRRKKRNKYINHLYYVRIKDPGRRDAF